MPHALCFTASTTPSIYPLSLHDALPIYLCCSGGSLVFNNQTGASVTKSSSGTSTLGWSAFNNSGALNVNAGTLSDRKSTRLNSSHRSNTDAGSSLKKEGGTHNLSGALSN